jgi:hypothetical protein
MFEINLTICPSGFGLIATSIKFRQVITQANLIIPLSTKMSGRAVVKYADETSSRISIPSKPKAPKKQRTLKELKEDIEKLKLSAAETEKRFSEIVRRAGPNSSANKTRVNTEEKLKVTQEHCQRQYTGSKTNTIDAQERLDALDDDIDVWNQNRRRVSDDLDFSVVGIDDESDCEIHTVPCGDPLCDRCTVVFSDVLDEYHDDNTLSKFPSLNSRSQSSDVLGVEPVVGNLISGSEQLIYFTSPVQQTRVGSSKDALTTYLRSRRRSSNTGVDLSKSQSLVVNQVENATSEVESGREGIIRSPLAELKAKLKAAAVDLDDHLNSKYIRRSPRITDSRVGDHDSTLRVKASASHNSDSKIELKTTVDKKEAKVDEHDNNVPATPLGSSCPNSSLNPPQAPAKNRSRIRIEVKEPLNALSFKERMVRTTGQTTPSIQGSPCCAEPLGTPRIGKGSRPPLSRSSCFNQGTCDGTRCGGCGNSRTESEDYFPYNNL